MPPKKAAKAKGPPAAVLPGQSSTELLQVYKAFCTRIGLLPHPRIISSLTNVENTHIGKQIIIDCGVTVDPVTGESKQEVPKLGAGGCRALCTAILGASPNMPKDAEGQNIIYKSLVELRIYQAGIGDDGVNSIAELLRLGGSELKISYLELFTNNITELGCSSLGKALQVGNNKSLITLSLDYNLSIKSEGLAALCIGLRTNSTVKKLSMRYCDLDCESGGPLAEVLSFNKSALEILDIQGNNIRGAGLLDLSLGLKRNTKLNYLNVGDNNIGGTSAIDRDGLTSLSSACLTHPSLTTLDLIYNRIGDGAELLLPLVDAVSGNAKLVNLRIDFSVEDSLFKKVFRESKGGKKKKGKGGGKKKKK